MAVSIGDIVRLTAVMNFANVSELQNVFYVLNDGSGEVSDFDFMDAAATWLDDAYTLINAAISDEIVYTDILGYNVTDDEPYLSEAWPVLTAGASVEAALPLQVAALVLFETRVKRAVGRKYIAGITDDRVLSGGGQTAGTTTLLETWGEFVMAGFVAEGEDFTAGHLRVATSAFIPWARVKVNPFMKTQRRRVVGVGV